MIHYPEETLDDDDDDGTMPANVATLSDAVVGHRIVSATQADIIDPDGWRHIPVPTLVLTLDNGKQVRLANYEDCCAYTELASFFLDPRSVDHVIMGVGTTNGYCTWHIYADWGDIMRLQVGWSCGNPFYYGYGFDISVVDMENGMIKDKE